VVRDLCSRWVMAIMVAVLGLNLLGDGLRDALDPQRR
jgi:ABC-type dipeptide/oligopeptide/nickel transport system permease subunit